MATNYGIRVHTHRGQRIGQRPDPAPSGPNAPTVCWRCGIDFVRPDTLIGDSPCEDCALDFPADTWLKPSLKPGRLSPEEVQARIQQVKELHQAGLLDTEIAERLGISRQTAGKWRKKLGLPVHYRPDKHLWKDVAAHQEHASHMVEHRKTHKRGKSPNEVHNSR